MEEQKGVVKSDDNAKKGNDNEDNKEGKNRANKGTNKGAQRGPERATASPQRGRIQRDRTPCSYRPNGYELGEYYIMFHASVS